LPKQEKNKIDKQRKTMPGLSESEAEEEEEPEEEEGEDTSKKSKVTIKSGKS